MLPRTKGIFHLGEEGGEAKKTSRAATIRELECSKGACERFEGLRIILIQHSRQRSNVVIKSSMKSCMQNTRPHLSPRASAPQLGFLKLCFLCKRELSPHKDVYMYRGDQGFCSEECRRRQILLDERRELEVSTRERSKAPHDRRAANKVHESDRHRRILVVA